MFVFVSFISWNERLASYEYLLSSQKSVALPFFVFTGRERSGCKDYISPRVARSPLKVIKYSTWNNLFIINCFSERSIRQWIMGSLKRHKPRVYTLFSSFLFHQLPVYVIKTTKLKSWEIHIPQSRNSCCI